MAHDACHISMQLLLDPDISTYIAQVYNVIKCINTWGRLSARLELVQVYIRLQNVPSLFVDPKKGQSANTIPRFYINTIKINTKFPLKPKSYSTGRTHAKSLDLVFDIPPPYPWNKFNTFIFTQPVLQGRRAVSTC